MELNTRVFGKISIDEEGIISFPEGIPGFLEVKKYVILGNKENSPFQWLQSVDFPDTAFVVTDPFSIKDDYIIDINDSEVSVLNIKDTEKILTLSIVVVPADVTKTSINLRAPILINTENKLGKQVMLNNDSYSVKHYIFEQNKTEGGQK